MRIKLIYKRQNFKNGNWRLKILWICSTKSINDPILLLTNTVCAPEEQGFPRFYTHFEEEFQVFPQCFQAMKVHECHTLILEISPV